MFMKIILKVVIRSLRKLIILNIMSMGLSYTSYITGNTYGIDDIGSKYTVYYNPSNPSKIVCPNSASSRVLILIILSLVSIILIIFNIRKFSKTSRNKKYKY